jgi:hypothetical protein
VTLRRRIKTHIIRYEQVCLPIFIHVFQNWPYTDFHILLKYRKILVHPSFGKTYSKVRLQGCEGLRWWWGCQPYMPAALYSSIWKNEIFCFYPHTHHCLSFFCQGKHTYHFCICECIAQGFVIGELKLHIQITPIYSIHLVEFCYIRKYDPRHIAFFFFTYPSLGYSKLDLKHNLFQYKAKFRHVMVM